MSAHTDEAQPAVPGPAGDSAEGWSSGVTLKRTTHGDRWPVSVAADGSDLAAMRPKGVSVSL